MAEVRGCEQCGAVFTPRREHARFCSPRCRVAWNRGNRRGPAGEASALGWSVTAMGDTIALLARVRSWDRPRAFVVVSEAVWWVTMVDATLVRHHAEAYDCALGALARPQRELVEGTLGGLRFVRNQMGSDAGQADFIAPGGAVPGPGAPAVTAWAWKPVPGPALGSLSPGGRAWELARHRAYQARLAGHSIGETFGRAAGFLTPAVRTAALGLEARTGGAALRPSRAYDVL